MGNPAPYAVEENAELDGGPRTELPETDRWDGTEVDDDWARSGTGGAGRDGVREE